MNRSSVKRDELGLFSYEILGLVGRSGPARTTSCGGRDGPHARLGGREPVLRRAQAAGPVGYLSARREPGKTRERTVYTLTDKGLAALREYAATPATFTPLKSDLSARLLLADLVGEQVTRDGLVGLREELVELQERLDESEETAATFHRSRYLLLVISFLRRYSTYADLVDEVERELVGGDAVPSVRGRDDGEPHDGVEAAERRWALDQVRLPQPVATTRSTSRRTRRLRVRTRRCSCSRSAGARRLRRPGDRRDGDADAAVGVAEPLVEAPHRFVARLRPGGNLIHAVGGGPCELGRLSAAARPRRRQSRRPPSARPRQRRPGSGRDRRAPRRRRRRGRGTTLPAGSRRPREPVVERDRDRGVHRHVRVALRRERVARAQQVGSGRRA